MLRRSQQQCSNLFVARSWVVAVFAGNGQNGIVQDRTIMRRALSMRLGRVEQSREPKTLKQPFLEDAFDRGEIGADQLSAL